MDTTSQFQMYEDVVLGLTTSIDLPNNSGQVTEYPSLSTTDIAFEDCHCPNRLYVNSFADDGGQTTMRYVMMNACPLDTIIFDLGLGIGTVNCVSPIVIDRDIVVIGNGTSNTFLNGQGVRRIFEVLPGRKLDLCDLTLENCREDVNGGAFYNQGSMKICRVKFKNNWQLNKRKAFTNKGLLRIVDGISQIDF